MYLYLEAGDSWVTMRLVEAIGKLAQKGLSLTPKLTSTEESEEFSRIAPIRPTDVGLMLRHSFFGNSCEQPDNL